MEPRFQCSGCQQFKSQGRYRNNGWNHIRHCNACCSVWDEEHKNNWRIKKQHQSARTRRPVTLSPITEDEHQDHEAGDKGVTQYLEVQKKEKKQEGEKQKKQTDSKASHVDTLLENIQQDEVVTKTFREQEDARMPIFLEARQQAKAEKGYEPRVEAEKEAQWKAEEEKEEKEEEEEEEEKVDRLQAEAEARQTSEKAPSQAELEAQQKVKEEEKAPREARPSITLFELTALLRSSEEDPWDRTMAFLDANLGKVTYVSPGGSEELAQRSLKGAPSEVEPALRALKGEPAQVQRVASPKVVKTPDVPMSSNEASGQAEHQVRHEVEEKGKEDEKTEREDNQLCQKAQVAKHRQWTVVGGSERGGLLVRNERELTSTAYDVKLGPGSLNAELERDLPMVGKGDRFKMWFETLDGCDSSPSQTTMAGSRGPSASKEARRELSEEDGGEKKGEEETSSSSSAAAFAAAALTVDKKKPTEPAATMGTKVKTHANLQGVDRQKVNEAESHNRFEAEKKARGRAEARHEVVDENDEQEAVNILPLAHAMGSQRSTPLVKNHQNQTGSVAASPLIADAPGSLTSEEGDLRPSEEEATESAGLKLEKLVKVEAREEERWPLKEDARSCSTQQSHVRDGKKYFCMDYSGIFRGACSCEQCECNGWEFHSRSTICWSDLNRTTWRNEKVGSGEACKNCGCPSSGHENLQHWIHTIRHRMKRFRAVGINTKRELPRNSKLPIESRRWTLDAVALYVLTSTRLDPRQCLTMRSTREAEGEGPLISVCVPTSTKRHCFHPLLYRNFQRQDYKNKELVVIDTGSHPSNYLETCAVNDESLRYYHIPVQDAREEQMNGYVVPFKQGESWSLGLKRNCAVHLSCGAIVCHFDDDDLYAPGYISFMFEELIRNISDRKGQHLAESAKQGRYPAIATLSEWHLLDMDSMTFRWLDPKTEPMPEEYREPMVYGYGFSYMFTRAAWQLEAFPDRETSEDDIFMAGLRRRQVPVVLLSLPLDGRALVAHNYHLDSTSGGEFNERKRQGQVVPAPEAFEDLVPLTQDIAKDFLRLRNVKMRSGSLAGLYQ